MLLDLVAQTAQQVIQSKILMISRIAAERKKFEDWLQLEVLSILMDTYRTIEIEKAFPGTQERCDFWLKETDGTQSWLEIKLCVTNYRSQFCETTSARPITNQISEVERDLNKLMRLPISHSTAVLLFAYPLPDSNFEQAQWLQHLARIKSMKADVSEIFSEKLVRNGQSARLVAYAISPAATGT